MNPPNPEAVNVCCHTHHKQAGEPCGFHGRVEPPCWSRRRHFQEQRKAQAKGLPLCPVCGPFQRDDHENEETA